MWLEQAVFTSTKSRQGEGYHVVAKSPGVSSGMTTALNRRCPSHGALQENASDFESLNFHRLTPNTLAVSRTVYGGKEYSNRGGLQVVTIVLVVKDLQLEGYVNDPFCLARMARSLGHLYVVGHTDRDNDTVGYLVSLVAARGPGRRRAGRRRADLSHGRSGRNRSGRPGWQSQRWATRCRIGS